VMMCFGRFISRVFLGGDERWWVYLQVFLGGYGVPSICGTICILFRPYLASCGDGV
jgi:hypothetical protein